MSDTTGKTPQIQSPTIQFEHGGTTDLLRSITPESKERRDIVLSTDTHLDDKLEAYEDIIDSEVGDTNLLRARNLEREFGIRQLFLKFEGGNPTGTQKDRIAFAQCMDALRRGYDTITLATCGNYGAACAFAAYFAGLRCIIFIPENYHTRRIKEMEELGAEILRVPGDYENAVECSTRYAAEHEYFDANPGGDNTILQLQAYGEIAFEVYDELRDAPKMVAGPVSNGTLMAGIHKGFVRLFRRGKTSRIPRVIVGSSVGKNPIVTSFIKGLDTCEDLDPEKIVETVVNEPLINWHSFDGEYALDSILSTNGAAFGVTDKKMLELSKIILQKEGISVLPASTAGLAALLALHEKEPLDHDRYLIILTGKK